MKLIHLADLHLGKKVHGYDLLEEQRDALWQVISLANTRNVQGIIIAGDVYDLAIPPVEAVHLLDDFLCECVRHQLDVYMISGNHDSAGRLEYGSRLLRQNHIHLCSQYDGKDFCIEKEDEWGKVKIHLLPFIKPRTIRTFCPDMETDYNQAFQWALGQMDLDPNCRHILVAHQFFAGSSLCESEEAIGGLDEISPDYLKPFDYCALGHLHKPQMVKEPKNRYCGTLLKYSASESTHQKTITLLNLEEDAAIEEIEVKPLHDLVKIQGTYMELTDPQYYKKLDPEDYYDIHLMDELPVWDAFSRLQQIYPKIMRLVYDKLNTPQSTMEDLMEPVVKQDPITMMSDFFTNRTQRELNDYQKSVLEDLWEEINHEAD